MDGPACREGCPGSTAAAALPGLRVLSDEPWRAGLLVPLPGRPAVAPEHLQGAVGVLDDRVERGSPEPVSLDDGHVRPDLALAHAGCRRGLGITGVPGAAGGVVVPNPTADA